MDVTDTVILGSDYDRIRAQAVNFAAELEACLTADEIDLPSLPDVVLKVCEALARDDVDLNRIAELAGADPALAALSHLLLTLKRTEIPPEDRFLAGLLHKVGTLFILLRSKDQEALWSEANALAAVIQAWQARIGAKIVKRWEFSPALIEAVREQDSRDLACPLPITLADVVIARSRRVQSRPGIADLRARNSA